ncbi:MAG: RagB/SusD family nutrient uptake outer membrane protein [Bacteroidales bacterium]|uniref:RagB/SusD family nutrient uptake outer membrane protein n=1 Tax=Porphyromonas sp. TaxID=1924944 RepID=UPI00297BB417|nr:RagB/SusD family nutrient uptake outer membrane protein [Porphyromonas sp.]MDD7438749.1 RagB/SusD family nutrient uptake outer membrane protein [Bacteroidales bacterium]MDY3067007.1 RagB/SusD family nutrient uptake outer membrane protein [Porphyromonas sp.]
MKRIIFSLSLIALLATLPACKKDHLEIDPTGSTVSDKKINKYIEDNPTVGLEMQNAIFRGLYSWIYTPGAGGTNGNMDFGQKSTDYAIDLLSGDFVYVQNDYGWWGEVQQYTALTNNASTYHYTHWRFYYRLIFTANGIISQYGEDALKLPADKVEERHALGQALAIRGYAYYYLSQLFTKEYDPAAKAFPVYTKIGEVNKSVATQQEVYAQILSDLGTAVDYLNGFKRTQIYEVDQNVAKAYLAYTHAAMGNYAEAEKLTNDFIGMPHFQPKDIVYNTAEDPFEVKNGGFNTVATPGVLWGTDLISDMGIDLYSWYGMVDVFTYSYASAGDMKAVSDRLYNSMREDDIRRGQFNAPGTKTVFIYNNKVYNLPLSALFGENAEYLPVNKFYPPKRSIQGQRVIETDYIYLRTDEMYLLNAEAKAMQGKDNEAKTILKNYLNGRIGDLSYIDGLSGQSLKDEIYLQTRIEFVGEGRSYLALRRFKKTAVLGSNRFDAVNRGIEIPYNDERMYFKIPNNEEVNNPNLYK